MAATTIEIEHRADAEREAIWALLADVTTWADWGEWDSAAPAAGPPRTAGPASARSAICA